MTHQRRIFPKPGTNEYTREELLMLADDDAYGMLGVSYAEALKMLDAGELKGTIAEIQLKVFRIMLAE